MPRYVVTIREVFCYEVIVDAVTSEEAGELAIDKFDELTRGEDAPDIDPECSYVDNVEPDDIKQLQPSS